MRIEVVVEPSKSVEPKVVGRGGSPSPQTSPASPVIPNSNPNREPAEPRASIETLCSLDISENIPKIVLPMDAEDSPWGGAYTDRNTL